MRCITVYEQTWTALLNVGKDHLLPTISGIETIH